MMVHGPRSVTAIKVIVAKKTFHAGLHARIEFAIKIEIGGVMLIGGPP